MFLSIFCLGQRETNHWFLNANHIEFNNGSINNQSPAPINFEYGSASLCDPNGNLLFVANGSKVYNRNLTPMPAFVNSNFLATATKLMSAPYPGQPGKHFLFYTTQADYQGAYCLRYAIIDLNLDGGLGDVTLFDNVVDTLTSAGYTLIQKKETEDFWLITHHAHTDSFFCRLTSGNGISLVPVVQRAGTNTAISEYDFQDLHASHDGSMFAGSTTLTASVYLSFVEVFNFNFQTAAIQSKVKSTHIYSYQYQELEFSPDNKLLYRMSTFLAFGIQPCDFAGSSIHQYNLCYTDSTEFENNSMYVGNSPVYKCVVQYWGKPQMGPDKKIYLPFARNPVLSRINFPNRIGSSSDINLSYHNLTFPTGGVTPGFYHPYIEKTVKNNISYSGGCYPAPIHFKVTNDTITSINWNFGDPASGGANTSAALQPSHTFSSPGIYVITASLYNSMGQLIETIDENVEIKDPTKRLLYDYPIDTTFCEGGKLRLKLNVINGIFRWSYRNGSTLFEWANGLDSFDITASGVYYVQMHQNDCDGCQMIDSIHVNVLPVPGINLGPDRNLCSGDSILLQAYVPTANNLWSTGEISDSIWVHTGGTYWLRSEFNNNGCPKYDTVVITEVPGVSFRLPGDTTLCNNQTLLLAPNVTNGNYLWQNGSTANNFLVTQAGTYWVRVTSANGCSKSDTIHVTYINAQNVNLGADSSLCIGDSLHLQTNVAGANYLWSTGELTAAITVHASGTYWLRADNGACIVSDTIRLTFNPRPVVSLGADTSICEKQVLSLYATTANAVYLWQNNSTLDHFVVQQPGLYWAQVIVSGCSTRDSIVVTYKPLPHVNIGNDTTLCINSLLVLTAADPSIQSYKWQDNSTQATFTVNHAGIYHVAVTGINDCINNDTIIILPKSLPDVNLGKDTFLCGSQKIVLDPHLTNVNLLWQDGSSGQTFIVTDPGVYHVTATNTCGSTTDQIIVSRGHCKLQMPNSFTPNRDGLNDVFGIKYPGFIKTFEMKIFNRWGEVIYSSHDPYAGWDGKYKGIDQPTGNYVWTIIFTDIDGKKESTKGYVLLLR